MTRSVILILFVFSVVLTRWVAFDDDEFQHAHMSVLIGRGEVPHRDFFEHHVPLYHMLHSLHMRGADGVEDLLRLRLLSTINYALVLLASTWLIRNRTGSPCLPVILLTACSPVFLLKMIEARPESPGIAFCMASFCLLSLDRPRIIWAGVLGCLMVLCSQKFVFLSLGLAWVAFAGNGIKGSLRLALGAALPAGVYLGFLLVTGSFGPAWDQLVLLNLNWKESFSFWMYGSQLWQQSGLLVGLTLWGLFMPERRLRGTKGLLLSGCLGVWLIPIPFRQTWLMIFPGLVLLAAHAWQTFLALFPEGPSRSYASALLLICGLLPGLTALSPSRQETLAADIAMMHQTASVTSGPVFDGRCLLFWRSHVGYYPWLHQGLAQMLDPESYSLQTQTSLEEAGFPPVIRDYRTELFPESLQTFIDDHYLPSDVPGLWQPGFRLDRSRLSGAGLSLDIPQTGLWTISWSGGTVFINDTPLTPGQTLPLEKGTVHLRGIGFIRNAQLIRTGERP